MCQMVWLIPVSSKLKMSRTIKLVIFDLDGTLVDAYPAIVESFNFTMRKMKLPLVDKQTIKRAVGWGDANLLKPFTGEKILKKALAVYRKHHAVSLGRKTRFLPGTKRLLVRLKKNGYKLALASNRPTKFSHIILEHLGIKEYFDYILCGDKVKKAKPYPDIIRQILRKLALKPNEALYIGDMTVDILAGKRAGVQTVAVTTGSNTAKELKILRPDYILENLSRLNRILEKKETK